MTRGDDLKTEFVLNPALCKFEQWHPYLPDEFKQLTLAQWLKRSREGSWAPYAKFLGERSTPFWSKSDIAAWFRHLFGVTHPEAVTALFEAGFEIAKSDRSTGMTPKSRRANNPRPRKTVRMPARRWDTDWKW